MISTRVQHTTRKRNVHIQANVCVASLLCKNTNIAHSSTYMYNTQSVKYLLFHGVAYFFLIFCLLLLSREKNDKRDALKGMLSHTSRRKMANFCVCGLHCVPC